MDVASLISRLRDSQAPEDRRLQDIVALAALCFLGILFFGDALFTSKSFYFRDILNFHYPLRRLLIDAYARGEFPLWNPFVHLGQPMLANPNYMAFYPTNLLHLFLPFNYAFKLHFILHPIIGGAGFYLLARRLGLTPLAGFSSATTWQFSGTVLSFLNLYNIVPAVGLLPWIAWAFDRSLEKRTLKRILVFGSFLALQLIALEPLMFQCSLAFLAGLALYRVVTAPDRAPMARRLARVAIAGGVFALALAAVQVIPTLELMPLTARAGGYEYDSVSEWSLHPADLVNLLVPNLFGSVFTIDRATYWGEAFHGPRGAYLVSYYLGGSALLLAGLACFSQNRALVRIQIGLLLSAIFMALGRFNPVHEWLFTHVPGFSLGRYPSKYFLLGTAALSLLAGLGLDALLRSRSNDGRRDRGIPAAAGIAVVLSGVLLAFSLYGRISPLEIDAWIRSHLHAVHGVGKNPAMIRSELLAAVQSAALPLLLAGAITFGWWRTRRAGLPLLLVMVTAAGLIPPNLQLAPLMSEADVNFVAPVNRYLAEAAGGAPMRVMSETMMEPLPGTRIQAPNRSSAWTSLFQKISGQPLYGITSGVQYSIDVSVDGLNTRDSQELWHAWSIFPQSLRILLLQRLASPVVLTLLEMKDPLLQPEIAFPTNSNRAVNVYRLSGAVPRVSFVAGVRSAAGHQEALLTFLDPRFDFRNAVLLEEDGIAERQAADSPGDARILSYGSARIECEVDARITGHLVLLDSFYPGWRALANGVEVPIRRANFAFRAVELSEGKHHVVFEYRPRSFYLGIGITAAALLFAAVVLFK